MLGSSFPQVEAYTRAAAEDNDGLRNQLVEHLLLLRKTVKRLNSRLNAFTELVSTQPEPTKPRRNRPPIPSHTAKVERAVSYARRGFLSRAAKSLLQDGAAEVDSSALSALSDLQIVAIDLDELQLIIKRKIALGAAAGPSGWTGELLLPLMRDKSCLEGLGALVLDNISNNALDAQSRQLLTSCLLLGIPKPNSDVLRPSTATNLTKTTLKEYLATFNLL
jgi:hypothetical protein